MPVPAIHYKTQFQFEDEDIAFAAVDLLSPSGIRKECAHFRLPPPSIIVA